MFPRCLPLVALSLVSVRCEAAPLSFNGARLGQTWDEVTKAYPKAWIISRDLGGGRNLSSLTRKQTLALASKSTPLFLINAVQGTPFWFGTFVFSGKKAVFIAIRPNTLPGKNSAEVNSVGVPLKEVLAQLGTPTGFGVVADGEVERRDVLIWEGQKQCAYVDLWWTSHSEKARFCLTLVDRPWASLQPESKNRLLSKPYILQPNQEDEKRRHRLFALLEQLQPKSTTKIRLLQPVAGIDLALPSK